MMAATTRKRSTTRNPKTGPALPSRDSAPPCFIARLVPLDPGFYAFSLAAETGWRDRVTGLALPAIHVCSPPHDEGDAIEITDSLGRGGAWLGGRRNVLFVTSPAGGGAALVTAYLARDPESRPLELDIRPVGAPAEMALGTASGNSGGGLSGSATPPPPARLMRLRFGEPGSAERSPPRISLEIIAHIRGGSDFRFVDAPWIGRLGPGLWIEALTITPRDQSASEAIEYKGLSAGGSETAWLGSGSPCGIKGQGIPLIGFAVRQKAGAGSAQFDCEYVGYFRSGAISGPARNGAPCRSTLDNDPLQGMQLRVTPRPKGP